MLQPPLDQFVLRLTRYPEEISALIKELILEQSIDLNLILKAVREADQQLTDRYYKS